MMLEQIGGAALKALFPADIFLTILYAPAGTGTGTGRLAPRWNRLVWTIVGPVGRICGAPQPMGSASPPHQPGAGIRGRCDRRPTRHITGPGLTKPSCH